MLPLIYTNIIYTLLFLLPFGIWAVSELITPTRWPGPETTRKHDRGSFVIGITGAVLGAALSLFLPIVFPGATITWNQPLVFFIGFAVMLFGIGCRQYAIRTLGRYFTLVVAIHPDQPIIQSGPYKLIRHPSYTGALFAMIGLGIIIMNWVSLLAVTAGILLALMYRIPIEERTLCENIGQPYIEYMQRTKRLIPFIY